MVEDKLGECKGRAAGYGLATGSITFAGVYFAQDFGTRRMLRVNSLKRYSKGGNGKNEEFDQIWWKVLWHDGKTPRHSGPAWGGPWGILWGKFFFPDFWNFWIFFFQNALSQAWLIWPMWNLDMFWRQHEILIWRKKILKFRKFVKTTFFYSFLPNGSFWGRIHSPNQI